MKRIMAVLASSLLVLALVGVANASSDRQGVAREAKSADALVSARLRIASPGIADAAQPTMRFAGRNRFETAVAISQASWGPEEVVTVFLATGFDFPDALAMAASTWGEGPLLLVERDRIPPSVVEELQRLMPCFVAAAGGTGVISDRVLDQAGQYADPTLCED